MKQSFDYSAGKLIILIYFIFNYNILASQNDDFTNWSKLNVLSTYAGDGIGIKYSKIISEKSNGFYAIGLGVGNSILPKVNQVCPEIVYFTGKNNKHFEIGLAFKFLFVNQSILDSKEFPFKNKTIFGLGPTIAYRYQRPKGGISFNIGVSPTISTGLTLQKGMTEEDYPVDEVGFWLIQILMPDISLGYSF